MYRFNYLRILVHCQVISSKLAELVTGHGEVHGTGACAKAQGECQLRGSKKAVFALPADRVYYKWHRRFVAAA